MVVLPITVGPVATWSVRDRSSISDQIITSSWSMAISESADEIWDDWETVAFTTLLVESVVTRPTTAAGGWERVDEVL